MTKMMKKGQPDAQEKRALTPHEEMDRLFDRMWHGGWMRPFEFGWPAWDAVRRFEELPRMDVIEQAQRILVRAELPGIKREEIEVSLTDNHLTLKAEHVEEAREEGEYHRSEIRRRSFVRTVELPAVVDADKAEAEFKEGVLEIRLPKLETTQRRNLEIK